MRRSGWLPAAVLMLAGCVGSPEQYDSSATAPASASESATPSSSAPAVERESLRGTLVYSTEVAGNQDVYALRLDGSEPVRLSDGPEQEFDPDLSDDGTRIAYRRNPIAGSDHADIWSMNIDGTDKRNLTNAPELLNWAPAWMPNGRIAYSSMRSGTGALELWTMAADGSDPRQVSEGWCEYAQPSPDGSEFVCAAAASRGAYDLIVVAATGERRALTTTGLTEFGPSWSPDGEWIVFSRDLGDRWALIQIRPDGTGEREVATEGVFATWDPVGHLVWTGPGGINVAMADGSGRIVLDYPAEFISWAGP